MKEKAIFIILDKFADWEYAPLAAVLNGFDDIIEGYDVIYASNTLDEIVSLGGLRVKPDITIEEIPEDGEVLILIGGDSWRDAGLDSIVEITKKYLDSGKIVGAICDASRFLGANGLLNNHLHTGNNPRELENEEEYINREGFRMSNSVRSKNLITANGQAPYEFARDVLLAIGTAEDSVDMWYDFSTMGLYKALEKYNLMMD